MAVNRIQKYFVVVELTVEHYFYITSNSARNV